MGSNKKAILILTAILLSSSFNFPITTFAEGDTICSGRITGTTRDYAAGVGTNINAGKITFDAHPGSGAEDNRNIDYSGNIYHTSDTGAVTAPANRGDAGCTNNLEIGWVNDFPNSYQYKVNGWAWDSNAGFISFSCVGFPGKNFAGGSPSAGYDPNVACGNIPYQTYVSNADIITPGYRELFGYAWNPTFGWIKFHSDKDAAITYGVQIDSTTGKSSGYAWTSAGIYLDFTGLTFSLDKAPVVAAAAWCKNKPYLCVEVTPDPTSLSFNGTPGVKVADGKQGYDVHVYFGDANGNPIDPISIKNLGDIKFNWKDSVRKNQLVDTAAVPGEAVNNKPSSMGVFLPVAGEPNHYKTRFLVTSHAPTSESKLSSTTSTTPAYLVNNEKFIDNPDGLTLPKADDNKLILENVTLSKDLVDATNKVLIPLNASTSPVFPNGKVNMPLKFRPAIYAELYANDKQDSILAYRSLPTSVKRGLKYAPLGNLNEISNDSVEFHVGYSSSQTKAQNGCTDAVFDFIVTDKLPGSEPEKVSSAPLDIKASSSISALLNKTFDLSITPEIPSNPAGDLPCKVASGASVYSIIKYTVDQKEISYFDNKLRRIGASLTFNPAVVVHGNILAQSTSAVQEGQPVLAAGSVNVDVVHNTIDENLKKYTNQQELATKVAADCAFTAMEGNGVMGLGDCPSGQNSYLRFEVGDEHVLYSKGNVTLNFSTGNWSGKWVIVSDGGNIFVDKNLYPGNKDTSKISLIAFRSAVPEDYYKTGNIYIHPDVTDIVATIVAGGSVFSYSGTHADLDATTGEPEWADYSAMIAALKTQLFVQGAISSNNTIGGANTDQGKNPKPYLLSGGGKIIPLPASLTDRMKAQYYDLNYLRMFKLDLELTAEGLPKDQKCGMGLTPDDQVKLLKGETVCGEKQPCVPAGDKNQANACDGINPLLIYDAQNTTGDLIVPTNITQAKGLNNDTDFNPVYVYAVAPDLKSFVFSKPGAINTSGK